MPDAIELEYQTARERIEKEIDEINKNEVLYATFFVAIHASLFQFNVANQLFVFFVSLILLLIPIYGILRYQAHANIIRIHESYIEQHIEPIFGSNNPKPPGLIKYYNEEKGKFYDENFITRTMNDFCGVRHMSPGQSAVGSGRLKKTRYLFWLIMLFLSAVFFVFNVADKRLSNIYAKSDTENIGTPK